MLEPLSVAGPWWTLIAQAVVAIAGAWVVTYAVGWWAQGRLARTRPRPDGSGGNEGVEQGGAIIGRIERLLIYVFVLLGELSAIGFLITAKSVYRFRDETQQTEYFLIGSLTSFAAGLIVSLAFRWLIDTLPLWVAT